MIVKCKECGSTNIQVKFWVNPNNFKIDNVCDGEENECWCEQCQNTTRCEWTENI